MEVASMGLGRQNYKDKNKKLCKPYHLQNASFKPSILPGYNQIYKKLGIHL